MFCSAVAPRASGRQSDPIVRTDPVNRTRQRIHDIMTFLFSRAVCALGAALSLVPASFAAGVPTPLSVAPQSWVSTGPVIEPVPSEQHRIVAMKDPTVVYDGEKWHVFATTAASNGTWSMAYINFRSWEEAAVAKPYYLDDNPNLAGYNCAPQVFYFRPQRKWYLIFQSPQPRYSTTENLTDPTSWSAPKSFFDGTPKSVVNGWLDYWIICDDTHAYLFFPDDHGRFYRSRTRIEDFPRGFDEPVVVLQEPNAADLFEGSCVYRIKGANGYMALVECVGPDGSRYYRAFTADRLDGKWTPMPRADSWTTPFAGPNNVKAEKGGPLWTTDISHGELLRDGYDETMTVDAQNLRFLYQGRARDSAETSYVLLRYRLALLHASATGSQR